jgi:murein DD-endopeptidase MepM/ murein hydrolase activator NlpD
MKKNHRYQYQHELLDFVKYKVNFRSIVQKFLIYVLWAVLFTVLFYFLYSLFFDTPEERRLKREKVLLQSQYELLQGRYTQIEAIMAELNEHDREIYRTIFHAEMPNLNRPENLVNDYDEYDNAGLAKKTKVKMQALQDRAKAFSTFIDEVVTNFAAQPSENLLAIPLLQPIENKKLTRIGASLGKRLHPFYKILKEHTGIDFIAGEGTDVFATAKGMVAAVQQSSSGDGLKVEIDHGNGYATVYAHMDKITVYQGQPVDRGQIVGTVGNTGLSVSAHLHYEVQKNGQYMEPLNYFFIGIQPEEYERLIQLSTGSGQSLD